MWPVRNHRSLKRWEDLQCFQMRKQLDHFYNSWVWPQLVPPRFVCLKCSICCQWFSGPTRSALARPALWRLRCGQVMWASHYGTWKIYGCSALPSASSAGGLDEEESANRNPVRACVYYVLHCCLVSPFEDEQRTFSFIYKLQGPIYKDALQSTDWLALNLQHKTYSKDTTNLTTTTAMMVIINITFRGDKGRDTQSSVALGDGQRFGDGVAECL